VELGHQGFEVTIGANGAAVVVAVTGEVDITTSPRLSACLDTAARSGHDLVIDLDGVSFIDASGLGALVRAANVSARWGATVVLRRPSALVQKMLAVAGLDDVLPVVDALNAGKRRR